MTLSWAAQYQKVISDLKTQLAHLASAPINTSYKLKILHTSILPKLHYGFHLAPYTQHQVAKIDSMICKFVKNAYGLKPYAPSATVHQDIGNGGLGCPSVMVQYATVQVQRLVKSLNDGGTLGALARSSLTFAKDAADKQTLARCPTLLRYSLRMRQLQAAAALNLQIHRNRLVEFGIEDIAPIVAEAGILQQPGGHQHELTVALLRDIALLQAMGISRLVDILKLDRCVTVTVKELQTKLGLRMDRAHRRALCRVSRWLHIGPAKVTRKVYTSTLKGWRQGGQTVHADIQRTITHLHLSSNAQVLNVPIEQMQDVQMCLVTPQAIHYQQIQQDMLRNVMRPVPQTFGNPTRKGWQDMQRPLARSRLTGHQTYHQLLSQTAGTTQKIGKKKVAVSTTAQLQQLYHNYADTQATVAEVLEVEKRTNWNCKGRETKDGMSV
jgi:hypothetical protein